MAISIDFAFFSSDPWFLAVFFEAMLIIVLSLILSLKWEQNNHKYNIVESLEECVLSSHMGSVLSNSY